MKSTISKLLTLGLCLGLMACRGPDTGTQTEVLNAEVGAKHPETLTIAITKDENTLAPFTYVSGTGLVANRLIYDTLLTQDRKGNIIAWMVEDDYVVSDDNKVFTFKLRDGQYFHNGQPVTVEDVKFSFEYPADKNVAGLRKITNKIQSIAIPDEKTIVFTLKDTDLTFERDGFSRMRIISKSVYEDVKDATVVKESIGSGMYRLVEYKTGQYYKLQAVNNYFRGQPKVKNINMPIVADATAVQQGLLSGQFAAATSNIGVETVEVFKKTAGLEICASPGYAPAILNFNNGQQQLSQVKLRQALAHGVDVKGISNTLYGDYATLGTRGLIRSDHEYAQSGLEYIYDKEKAIALLQELGYTKINPEGYRLDEKGDVLGFEILTYSGNTIRSRMAELVAANLKEIGIKIDVKSMEMDTVDAYVWPDFEVSKGRNYDMATWGWSNTNTPTFLLSLCSSDFIIGTYNVMGYKSATFDHIVSDQYNKLKSMKQMTSMLQDLQKVVAEEVPALVIAYPDALQACNTQKYSGWKTGKGLNVVNIFSFLE